MTLNLYIRRAVAGALALSLLLPSLAFAQTGIDAAVNATVQTPGVGASASVSAAVMTRAKEKANKEIDRRIKALNDLALRISGVTKISAEFKQNLNTNVQNQITLLSALKVKIDADTDSAILRADVKSISDAYRIFILITPQARIAAAADREATIINMLAGLGAKLQARITEAGTAGADVTALNTLLVAMGTSLSSAQVHAQNAVTGSATLAPDGGDAAKMKSNTEALKASRVEIEAAHKDLVAARKAAGDIVKGLKTLKVNASASGEAQVTP
ncbi:MAG: hypothetical protein G01um101456_37 [Parcubacteria group bacterium Gr01-1014_56]|nr:MAG: hypothetical protein G01um101456_37 [Parcubacteria group bacterium Gr01-1014_56]